MVGLSVLYKNTLYILTLPYILTKLYPFSNSSSGYMFVLKAHKDLWGHKHNSHTKSHNSALPFDKIVPLFHLKKFVLKNCSFPSNEKIMQTFGFIQLIHRLCNLWLTLGWNSLLHNLGLTLWWNRLFRNLWLTPEIVSHI